MSTKTHLLLNLSFFLFAPLILFASLFNQSLDQTAQKLGLATPPPLIINQEPVEILVPSHGNYSLVDPGLLPTHFFYPLKMVKDRLFLAFTFNPERRAQLLFQYSNTRMSAADELIKLGHTTQAVSTAIKGQAYFLQAIDQGRLIPPTYQSAWYDSLRLAVLKHEEIIEKLRLVAQDQSRDQANLLWDQLGYYRQQITSFSGAPFNYPRPEDQDLPTATTSANL